MTTEEKKQEFIGNYLDRKMKGHGLDGMAYYNLLSSMIDKAEKAWDRKNKSAYTLTKKEKSQDIP